MSEAGFYGPARGSQNPAQESLKKASYAQAAAVGSHDRTLKSLEIFRLERLANHFVTIFTNYSLL